MRLKWISLCIALVLLFSACKKAEDPAGATSAPSEDTPKPTLAAPEPTLPNALVLSDLSGKQVSIPSQPKQIISLSPAVTETLFALNCGSSVIGAGALSDYPVEAATLPRFSADAVEAIIEASPDVVFTGRSFPASAAQALQDAGIPVAMAEGASYSDVFVSISFLSSIMGADSSPLILQMNEKALAVDTRDYDFEPVSALLVLSDGADGSYRVAGDNSIFNEMIAMLRCSSATAGTGLGESLTAEQLAGLDPQVVLVASDVDIAAIDSSEVFGQLSAVQADRVFPIDVALVTRPGPRIVDGLNALYDVLEQAANS